MVGGVREPKCVGLQMVPGAFKDVQCLETLLFKGNRVAGVLAYADLPANMAVLDASFNQITHFRDVTDGPSGGGGGGGVNVNGMPGAPTTVPLLRLVKLDLSHNMLTLTGNDTSLSPMIKLEWQVKVHAGPSPWMCCARGARAVARDVHCPAGACAATFTALDHLCVYADMRTSLLDACALSIG